MRSSKWTRAVFAGLLIPPLVMVAGASPAAAQAPDSFDVASPLSPGDRITGEKALTSRLAQTDRSLLGRTDGTPIQVTIKLDYDSIATYQGGVRGFAPTSPSVTGRALSGAADEKRYDAYVADRESSILGEIQKRVPTMKVSQRLRIVYGGVAATVPANKIGDLLAVKGVVAVQRDTLHQPLTDSSASFIGASNLYPQLGGNRNAGRGVIFGVLDTGAWP